MKIFIKMLVSICLSSLGISHAQLIGTYREKFIKDTQKVCFNTQRQASVNSAVSDGILKQYCRCSAEYVADLLNNQLANEVEKGNVPINPSWNNLAAAYCRKNYGG